jgi:uncharacterized protein YndB with AHSA1/START domain
MKREALRVTSTIPVAPTTLYFAWLDSAHHTSMTGSPAKVEPVVGAKYSTCNGYVTGKLVILDLGRRIVMSWRTTDFPRDAADSRVEVHFETLGLSTRILVLHTDIPEGQGESNRVLWNEKYITPMRVYFSKFLPDPRNPPVRRVPPPPPEDSEDEEEDEEELPKAKGKLGAKGAPAAKVPPAVPSAAKSGPGVHKAESKAPAKASKSVPPAKAAPAKAAPAKAAPAKAAPAKAAPAKVAKAAKAAKPAPAAKAAPPAKGKGKPAKPAPKAAAKKPAPKKPAPKPAKGKKKR